MRFHLTITNNRTDIVGTERAEITYSAGSWDAAGRAAERYQRDLGMDGPSYSSLVTYASERDAPKSSLASQIAAVERGDVIPR